MATESMLIKPEPKKPEHSVSDYVKYFDRIVHANKWSDTDAARLFFGLLEVGSTVLDELDAATLKSWEAIKAVIVPKEECYREVEVQKLFSISMRNTESVDIFQKRCRDSVQACYPRFAKANKELLTRDRFVHGLTDQLKKVVLNQRCEKLEEAIQSALLAENVKVTLEKSSPNPVIAQRGASRMEKGEVVTERKWNVRCFQCKQMGHYARNCPVSVKAKQSGISCVEKCSTRPMIDTVVNGCRTKMLIDSGSSVSLLPGDRFEASEPVDVNFRTASNSPLRVEGTLSCQLRLCNWEGEHTFYVGDVAMPVLGMDFLGHHSAVLDARLGQLTFAGGYQVAGMSQEDSSEDDRHYIATVFSHDGGHSSRQAIPIASPEDLAPEFTSSPTDKGNSSIGREVDRLRTKFTKVFNGLGSTNIVTHKIETGDLSPICLSSHRLPIHFLSKANVKIAELAQQGIIRKSRSPWCNPVVLVPKKSGDIRVAIDFRKLNESSRRDAYPMPRVDESLERLRGARFFTVLDCNSGYYQIKLEREDQQKTAFRFNGELWEFTRMPFGLSAAPATFCRLMRILFANEAHIVCYLDDICIFSSTYAEHMKHVERALTILQQAGMTLNSEKCKFFKEEIQFLGFRVKEDHIYPNEEKWKAMKNFPRPRNVKELQRFLGLLGYYRTMIPNFGMIMAPLYRLTQKKYKFMWGAEQERAFETIKEALMHNVVRLIPDPNREFIVRTDACAEGIGALLLQEIDSGERVIIECASKQFDECQKRYPVIEQEAYAIMFAVERWERFLLGAHFCLETDHRPLEWLKTKKDCRGKLGRWALRLANFEFSIRYVPGKKNADADALSRVVINSIEMDIDKFRSNQSKDVELKCAWEKEPGKYRLQEGLLYRTEDNLMQLCIAKTDRLKIWHELHDALGHGGPKRILELARQRFYWPGIRGDVKKWARQCQVCMVKKDFLPYPSAAPMVPVDYSQLEPMEKISIDVMGPFPETADGCKYILVMEDCFTKWAEARPVDRVTAKQIVEWLQDIFTRFALPREIVLDQGANMEAAALKEACQDLGISLRYITAYHHQSNPVERLNRTLLNLLRMYVSEEQKDWAKYVPLILFAYRVSVHSSINASPFEAMYGKPPRLPVDLKFATRLNSPKGLEQLWERMSAVRRNMRSELLKSSQKAVLQYDKRHKVQEPTYKVGDLVYIRNYQCAKGSAKKLANLWKGPFKLVRQLSLVDWLVKGQGSKTKAFHVNLMKPCGAPEATVQLGELRGRGRPPGKTSVKN